MKGMKDFVVEKHDRETWMVLQREAGLPGRMYVPVTEYPDEDLLALLETASEMTETPIPDLLHAFGVFLIPHILETYDVHVSKEWSGLELIANVGEYIHTPLTEKHVSKYTPPELVSEWKDEDTVNLVYRSERELCHLARGLFDGISDYFDEEIDVEEPHCMHEGDDHCEFIVERTA